MLKLPRVGWQRVGRDGYQKHESYESQGRIKRSSPRTQPQQSAAQPRFTRCRPQFPHPAGVTFTYGFIKPHTPELRNCCKGPSSSFKSPSITRSLPPTATRDMCWGIIRLSSLEQMNGSCRKQPGRAQPLSECHTALPRSDSSSCSCVESDDMLAAWEEGLRTAFLRPFQRQMTVASWAERYQCGVWRARCALLRHLRRMCSTVCSSPPSGTRMMGNMPRTSASSISPRESF